MRYPARVPAKNGQKTGEDTSGKGGARAVITPISPQTVMNSIFLIVVRIYKSSLTTMVNVLQRYKNQPKVPKLSADSSLFTLHRRQPILHSSLFTFRRARSPYNS
jgi:hypothetical protein